MRQYTLVWVDKEIVDREGDSVHTFRIHGKVVTQTTSPNRVLKAVEGLAEVRSEEHTSELQSQR